MTESHSTITAPIRFTRRLQASPADVFECFADESRLARWFSPTSDYRILGARCEPRAGGLFQVELQLPDGGRGRLAGIYRQLQAPRALRFDLGVYVGAEAGPKALAEASVEVDLRRIDDETELELRVLIPEEHPFAGLFREAWNGMLGRLPLALDGFVESFVERVSRFPRYRSQFGGLWPDLSDAERRIAGKVELGTLSKDEGRLFEHWREKGYVVLEGAVAESDLDRFDAEHQKLWARPDREILVECFRNHQFHYEPMAAEHRALPHKLLDLHARSEAARDIIFSAPIRCFLEKLFERPAMAFQSLLFERGTGQTMHQDTAFVGLSSPMEFVGVWIALEDIVAGSGELCYYEGSHQIDEYLWLGRSKVKPYGYMDEGDFFRWVVERSEAMGLNKRRFLARRGDALVWHADLVHGGSPKSDPSLTRRSLVTHLCPVDVDPEYIVRDPSHRRHRHGDQSYWCAMNRS